MVLGYISELKRLGFRACICFTLVVAYVWYKIDLCFSSILLNSNIKVFTASPMEYLQVKLYVCCIVSVLIVFPYAFLEVYLFISSALEGKEKKLVLITMGFAYTSFFIGCVCGFKYFVPTMLNVLGCYIIGNIESSTSLYNLVSFYITLSVASGVMFCIPFMCGVLTYTRIIKCEHLYRYVKYFIVSSLVFSAFITPGTDVFSMVLMEVPVIVLYIIGIVVSKCVELFR